MWERRLFSSVSLTTAMGGEVYTICCGAGAWTEAAGTETGGAWTEAAGTETAGTKYAVCGAGVGGI